MMPKLLQYVRWIDGCRWLSHVRPLLLSEAENFLHVDRSALTALAARWPTYVETLFNPEMPEAFYLSWRGEVGASNIAANIYDQLSRPHIASALIRYLPKCRLLDYGCGSGAIALAWQRTLSPSSHLLLADVENLSRDFLRHYAKTHPKYRVTLFNVDLEGLPDHSVDAALCIDVLEHLRNPSTAFHLIDRKLKPDGLLILQAPWEGGHREHLAEAPVNWRAGGGQRLLAERYVRIRKLGLHLELSAIYRKKR